MAERILGRDEIAEMEKLTVDRVVEAIDDAIKATSIQGKPNFVDLLRQPYGRVDLVIAKGARRAVKLGAEGAWSRLNVTPAMIQKLAAMAAARRQSGEED